MAVRKKRRRKKKQLSSGRRMLLAFLGALVVVAGIILIFHKPELDVKQYPEFGIEIPVDYTIHGIDVSRYQKTIVWDAVKAMNIDNIRIDFAFIKATEGENDTDDQFKRNWKLTQKVKLTRGAYHFFIPSKDPQKQAANFIRNVTLASGDLPPVLDVEQTNNMPPAVIQAKVKVWLNLVEAHYKVRPVLYTNSDFYEKNLGRNFDDYPLWVAHYYEKRKPRVKRDWLIWQHNDAGHVNGINAYVDFNVFNGDSVAFRSLLVK